MLEKGRVGQFIISDGGDKEYRLGRYAGQALFDSHGVAVDAVTRGNCFMASTQTHVNFGSALTASAVTLTLYNPIGSGRNLVLLEATVTVSGTVPESIVYAVNDTPAQAAPVTTTPITIHNCLLGAGGASVAGAFSVATLPAAPVAVRTMFSTTANATTGQSPRALIDRVDGRLILTPNTAVTLQAIGTAGGVIGFISMLWEEVLP